MIDHSDCKYFYISPIEQTKNVYEALLDKTIEVIIGIEDKDCCAVEPTAIILDPDQPLCKHYIRKPWSTS